MSEASPEESPTEPLKRFRVRFDLRGPSAQEICNAGEGNGGLPDLGAVRPLFDHPFSMETGDGSGFVISPFVDEWQWRLAYPGAPIAAWIDLEIASADLGRVLGVLELPLEEVLDQLSFYWNYPVEPYSFYIVDFTPPVRAGDKRQCYSGSGFNSPKYRESQIHIIDPGFTGEVVRYRDLSEPVRSALRWFAVALKRQPDAQRFVALWIALELIVNEKVKATILPYKAPCGHEIENCPVCQAETKRRVGGAQVRSFLVEQAGLDPTIAHKLWKTRQVVHGANKLTPADVSELPASVGYLRQVVQRALGAEMGLTPTTSIDAAAAISWISLVGECEVSDADLNPFKRTFPPFSKPLQRTEYHVEPGSPLGGFSGFDPII